MLSVLLSDPAWAEEKALGLSQLQRILDFNIWLRDEEGMKERRPLNKKKQKSEHEHRATRSVNPSEVIMF